MTRASQAEPAGPSPAKRRILTAAAKLFRDRGYARSTVRELADAVGILSGSLFHHFRSKDDILFAVMEEVITAMDAEQTRALDRATTTREKVRALIRNHLDFIHGPRGDATAVLVYEWSALSPEGQAQLLALRNAFFARWHEVLDAARAEGLTAIDSATLRQLLHGAIVWTAHWYDPAGRMTPEQLENAILALALREAPGD